MRRRCGGFLVVSLCSLVAACGEDDDAKTVTEVRTVQSGGSETLSAEEQQEAVDAAIAMYDYCEQHYDALSGERSAPDEGVSRAHNEAVDRLAELVRQAPEGRIESEHNMTIRELAAEQADVLAKPADAPCDEAGAGDLRRVAEFAP